jgi:hypothetical protein
MHLPKFCGNINYQRKKVREMGRNILACLLAVVLIALLGISVTSAQVASPDLESIKVIHYAKGGIPGPPPKEEPPPVDNSYYEILGPKWGSTVSYRIDPDLAPAGAVGEIEAAFEAWDAVTSTELFAPAIVDPGASASLDTPDGVNTVTFRVLAGLPKALAVTVIWYVDVDGSGTMTEGDMMYDTDMIFNLKFKWAIDPDGEGRLKADAKGKYYDVRNIAIHEAGHVVGLDDLYDEIYSELTMYGSAGAKETKKISLETGDIAGAQYLYGAPPS